ncbi:MAG: RNA polymerase sigma factor [Pseudomonadales bacterium]
MNNIISLFSRANKTQPFEHLLAPHISGLYRQAYQYAGCASDADDLLQDLLLELFNKQEQMSQAENLPAWLNRCLYHRFIDRCRTQSRAPEYEDIDALPIKDERRSNEPEQFCLNRQIVAGLQGLNPIQRAVVSLHDINGFSLPELASIVDMPLGTLKSHLHRARKQLKKNLRLQPFDEPARQSV